MPKTSYFLEKKQKISIMFLTYAGGLKIKSWPNTIQTALQTICHCF